jgi:hypothetical protein
MQFLSLPIELTRLDNLGSIRRDAVRGGNSLFIAADFYSLLQNQSFLSNEYIVRNDLLVAPVLKESESQQGWRSVYLPGPDSWFRSNLRWDSPGTALREKFPGGKRIDVATRISKDNFEDLTPMYIREG